MAKLLIKQRFLSWTDTYDVYNCSGEPKYYVKAEAFTIGHRIHLFRCDTKAEVARIDERVFSFLQRANISVMGRELGTITRRFTFFVPKYDIDYNGWSITGDILGWDYAITDSAGNSIASVSRELFHWTDTYALDIIDEDDELAALITVISIDMMNCGG